MGGCCRGEAVDVDPPCSVTAMRQLQMRRVAGRGGATHAAIDVNRSNGAIRREDRASLRLH